MGRQMTPCKRVAKEDLINWIVTRVHRFNLTANSVKRILNVIVDPFVIKIICVFPLEVKKFRPLSKDKGRAPPGGGTPHMKGVGMLVGNFELNP